ncbi:unnamed protein product, partial [Vitis vinifera]
MTGATISLPTSVSNIAGVETTSTSYSASLANSFRLNAVLERLAMHVRSGHRILDGQRSTEEFHNLCLSLARGIDYSLANGEVPARVQDLPLLLKQICQRRNDLFLLGGIMVLMVSVKNACKVGWFTEKDTEELLTLVNEIGSNFCNLGDNNTEPISFHPTISKIMTRFYPRMEMGQILASREVKPGYGTFLVDFHISKSTKFSSQEKIRLFVAQTDNIETSSCIITPPQVNFLLNGKGVERRTNVFMDSGPQIPTNVTPMLKYGTNLLQAVGQFNGHYILAIAFMAVISSPDNPVLQDYVQPAVSMLHSDNEIVEGPSRISLNCPISRTRIKVPVKGHSCKHLQCFDFGNFVEINSRRPSWRCPHCNQYVCYTDIRIDQNMVKVLKEVGENVADVIISADGSWKAILESNDHVDQPRVGTLNSQQKGPDLQGSTSFSNASPNVWDLTEGDDEMNAFDACEIEDRKPFQSNIQVQDGFCSGILLSTYGSSTHSARSDAQFIAVLEINFQPSSDIRHQCICITASLNVTELEPTGCWPSNYKSTSWSRCLQNFIRASNRTPDFTTTTISSGKDTFKPIEIICSSSLTVPSSARRCPRSCYPCSWHWNQPKCSAYGCSSASSPDDPNAIACSKSNIQNRLCFSCKCQWG